MARVTVEMEEHEFMEYINYKLDKEKAIEDMKKNYSKLVQSIKEVKEKAQFEIREHFLSNSHSLITTDYIKSIFDEIEDCIIKAGKEKIQ